MKTAGIRELKGHLSSYLRGVQQGEALFITDRGRIVAEVHPPGTGAPIADPEAHRRAKLVDKGSCASCKGGIMASLQRGQALPERRA